MTMINLGFNRGIAPLDILPPRPRHKDYIHGDDYVSVGKPEDLQWMKVGLDRSYKLKTQTLGPAEEPLRQVNVLNRIISWTKEGIEYEADPRHAELVIKDLGLEDANGVVTPGPKDEGTTKDHCATPLKIDKASEYLSIVARPNYLSQDRADIVFSVKELPRTRGSPTEGCWERLKRFGRYLVSIPRVVYD